tara:strand:+ start:72 stop:503 length:432 start_codon:yes stop_codon:yes gene_type:complete
MIEIDRIESFDDVKNYLDAKLTNQISDDGFSGYIDFSTFNRWYKFTSFTRVIGLYMIRPINSVMVELHPIFKSQHAKHAKELSLRLIEDLKKEGVKSFICEFPDNNTATVKLAESCGFDKIGIKERSWLKNGELIDILIYQKV